MESYVTRREFENVLKEVRRLQFFLADTFGPKFMEFFKDDKFLEAESRLNGELGSFATNVLNASLKMGVPPPPPPPQSQPVRLSSAVGGVPPPTQSQPVRLSSAVGGVPPPTQSQPVRLSSTSGGVPPPSSIVLSLPPPTPALPGAKTPISNYNFSMDYRKSVSETQSAPSARLLITEALHARDRLRLKGYKNQDKILDAARAKLSSATPSSSQPTPSLVSPVVPISVVRAYKRKVNEVEEDEFEEGSSSSPKSPEIQEISSSVSVGGGVVEKEYIMLEDDDENDRNQSTRETPAESTPPSDAAPPPPKISKPAPLPSFRNSKLRSLNCGVGDVINDEIIQCRECGLYIYKSSMNTHLKTHSLLNGNGKNIIEKDKPSSSSSSSTSSSPSSFFKQPLHCFLCRQEFATFILYEDHCDSHHLNRHPCPICLKSLKQNGRLKPHMKAHDNPKCVCIVCGKCCNRPDPLNYHIQTCNLEKAEACFYCSFCDLKFDSKNKRDRHLQSVHKNHYKFEEVCKKVGCQSLLSAVDKSPQVPEQEDNKNVNEIGVGGGGVGGGGSSSSSVIGVGAGELIDVTTQIKVDISNTLQFEYEGDDDELV